MMKDVVSQQSDVTYWSCVARKEIAGVIEESKNSVGKLVTLIKQRVDLGYTDPGDLLMAEVKYNEIEYLYQQAQTSFATTVMALNSLIGVDLDNQTEVDSVVEPFTTTGWVSDLSSNTRPEEKMARNMISITESDKKIVNSNSRPQLNLRIEGSYTNPAYDFSRVFQSTYAVLANFSSLVFE